MLIEQRDEHQVMVAVKICAIVQGIRWDLSRRLRDIVRLLS